MTEPPVYLIDEPTAGIDPRTSEDIYELIAALARDSGKAILLVDQDIKSALAIADYVYVVKNGSVASHGSRAKFGGDTDALVARWLYASGRLTVERVDGAKPPQPPRPPGAAARHPRWRMRRCRARCSLSSTTSRSNCRRRRAGRSTIRRTWRCSRCVSRPSAPASCRRR